MKVSQTITVARAVVGARSDGTVWTRVSLIAVAGTVVALAMCSASVEARLERAVVPLPTISTCTIVIHASAVFGAITRARALRTVLAAEPKLAVTGTVVAVAMR